MKKSHTRRGVAAGLTVLFTALWWWVLIGSLLVGTLVLTGQLSVGIQIGPNGEPNLVAGSQAQMVLPVAFELDAGAAQVTSRDRGNTGAIEQASGLLRLTAPDRPSMAAAAAAIAIALVLWVLAELAALCRSVRDRHPFVPDNVRRIRRLALALALGEISRGLIVYSAH